MAGRSPDVSGNYALSIQRIHMTISISISMQVIKQVKWNARLDSGPMGQPQGAPRRPAAVRWRWRMKVFGYSPFGTTRKLSPRINE